MQRVRPAGRPVSIGLACPYTWDVPGGVQVHVRDLAEALIDLGHDVSVITPVDDETTLPAYAVDAGRAMPVPYNGSVSRILLGPVSAARVRRWLRDGALRRGARARADRAECQLGRLHARGRADRRDLPHRQSRVRACSTPLRRRCSRPSRSLRPTSPCPRRPGAPSSSTWGSTPCSIPNGVAVQSFAAAPPLPASRATAPTIAFLGRIDEPRKGLDVLLEALPRLAQRCRMCGCWSPARAMSTKWPSACPATMRRRVHLLGLVSRADKRRLFHTADVYCAPNTGQESFGIVLLEAMAARHARRRQRHRRVPPGARRRPRRAAVPGRRSSRAGRRRSSSCCSTASARADLSERGRPVVAAYDWPVVAADIVTVYETVVEGDGVTVDERATVRY